MNAKQIQTNSKAEGTLNLSLISLEQAQHPSIWDRIKKVFSAPSDLNLETWERLEMKRSRSSFTANQWRNF